MHKLGDLLYGEVALHPGLDVRDDVLTEDTPEVSLLSLSQAGASQQQQGNGHLQHDEADDDRQ